MNQAQFDRVFNDLSPKRREVLLKFLAGETDQAIAKSLTIADVTVRQHIKEICDAFDVENDFPDERKSRRPGLKELCAKYKPDLVKNSETGTPNEDEPAEFDLNFVGRDTAITELNNLVRQGAKVIVIQAAGGVGKTTLAQEYLKTQGFELVIELPMAKETENITAVESVIEEWLKQDFKEEPGREFGITLGRLKRQLQTRRVGILIDNLEPALDQQGKFIEPHRRYVELLRVLADSTVQSVTLMTSRERLCESGVAVEHYQLLGLDEPAWHQFFSNRNINIDAPTLKVMHNAYGGNAKAMRIFCGAIREDFDGDMAAYWQENGTDLLVKGDLKDLITSQFKRLQEICPKAYKLLCRLGCFRYQDVPVVPTDGILCLLWDAPEAQYRQIIESLRNRSLVECRKGEYWLHPVIRAEAISRLRDSEDWQEANRKAAKFWTESVKTIETIEDAMTALEAYHHCIQIHEFEEAGNVIIKTRANKWAENPYLGVSLYRLGLLEIVKLAIETLTNKVKLIYTLCKLFNIIGDVYWIMGIIQKSIYFHQKSSDLASELLLSHENNNFSFIDINSLRVASKINIGLCQIDLGELDKALITFNDAIFIIQSNSHEVYPRYINSVNFCLAFLYCSLGIIEKALIFTKKVSLEQRQGEWGTGYRLFFLGSVYKNIEKYEESFEMYCRALSYAEESHYTQVKAKALYGLAELYREQGDFDTALSHHSEAIELLDKIGAKCDLAEAYYQLALTYQRMGEAENGEVNFQEAIRLYTEMEAPKQIEKVRQAMANK